MGFQEPSSGKIAEIALCKHWPHHQNHRNIMSEITTTSKVQTDGIEQINQAVEQMDQVTQSNAALVEEAAAAAQALEQQAQELQRTVGFFHLERSNSNRQALSLNA